MREPGLEPKHWAFVLDACGLAACSIMGLGVAVQHTTTGGTVIVIGGAALVAVAALSVVLAVHGSFQLAGLIGIWGLLAIGWLAAAHTVGDVWNAQLNAGLFFPALLLTAVTIAAYNQHLLTVGRTGESARRRRERARLAWWGNLLAQCGIDGVLATAAVTSERGQAITLTLPGNGRVTIATLQRAADGLAAALQVAPGAITFQQGRHAGEVIWRIDNHNSIGDDIPYPPKRHARTVNDPLPIGIRTDGQPATVTANMSTLITGVTGSGKTNILNVIIATLSQCDDVIIYVIDLKGGRLAAPWIMPWVEGRCPRPVIDWVATTRCEAALMLHSVDQLITSRGSTLAGGIAKARASRALPQIVVIVDEMADVTGDLPRSDWEDVSPADLSARGAKATRKARSEAVSMWWATQKGTVDFTGSSAIKSQCKQRLSLAVASETDARSVSDNNAVVRLLAQAAYPGTVVVEAPGQRDAILTKAWRLDGDADARLIDWLAERGGHTVPDHDPGALAVYGERYARRWERSGLYQLLLADFHARTGAAPLPPRPEPARPGGVHAAALADLDIGREAADLFARAGLGGAKPDPEGRMWALLADHRAMGLSVIEIRWAFDREGLSAHRSSIYRWLARAEQDGKVRRVSGEGDAARWVLS